MTRLAAIIAALRASRGTCACGDAYEPHRHYRRGWECTRCDDCKRYRRLGLRQRVADALAASKADPVEAEIDKAIANVTGAAGPSDAEINQMIRDYKKGRGNRA